MKNVAGLQAVVWSSQSVAEVVLYDGGDDKLHRFIVSHQERFVFSSTDISKMTQKFEQTPPSLDSVLCFLRSPNKGLTFFNTASQRRSGFKKPKRFV